MRSYDLSDRYERLCFEVLRRIIHPTAIHLTFNLADFKRYQEITVVDPKAVQ